MMNPKEEKDDQPRKERPEQPPPPPEGSSSATGDAREVPVEAPEDDAAVLRRQRDEFESKYLRAAADFQNFVRRSQQNIVDARQQQLMDVARAVITVMDHFDMALQVDPERAAAKDVLAGVQMVHDELLTALEKFGVHRITAVRGEEFDPHKHEAVMRQLAEDLGPNHVVSQLQPGFAMGERTLRPAKVAITQE